MITPQETREAFKKDFKDLLEKYNAKIAVETSEYTDHVYLSVYIPKDDDKITPYTSFCFRIDSTISIEEIANR